MYQGQWHQDTKCGHGRLVVREGGSVSVPGAAAGTEAGADATGVATAEEVFAGEWFNDCLHGRGMWRASNGDSYEGEFKHGVRDGIGKFTSADGDVYNGAWCDGRKHGQGTWISRDGDSHKGGWKDNVKHGKGSMARPGEEPVTQKFTSTLKPHRKSARLIH